MTNKSFLAKGRHIVDSGDWQRGLAIILENLASLSKSDNSLIHALALFEAGHAYEILSDWDNARLYYRDALRLYDHLEEQRGISKSRAGLGSVLVCQGHFEKGMIELDAALDFYKIVGELKEVAQLYTIYQKAQEGLDLNKSEINS